MPILDPFWVETYGRVVSTGVPVRFERHETALDRWFDVVAYAPEGGRFAVIFSDISARKEAEAALAERTRQLEAIRSIGAEITRELDLPILLELITRRAGEILGNAVGAFFLWDEAGQRLVPEGWYGEIHPSERAPRQLGEGLVGTVAVRREGLCVNDYRTSPYAVPHVIAHTDITAAIAEPLLYRDRLLGVLSLSNRGIARRFSEQDREVLRLFADHAAVAVENARLFAELNTSYTRLQDAQAEMIRTEKLRALGQLGGGDRPRPEQLPGGGARAGGAVALPCGVPGYA